MVPRSAEPLQLDTRLLSVVLHPLVLTLRVDPLSFPLTVLELIPAPLSVTTKERFAIMEIPVALAAGLKLEKYGLFVSAMSASVRLSTLSSTSVPSPPSSAMFVSVVLPSVKLKLRGEEPLVLRSEEHTSELQSQFHLVCRP